MLILLLLVSCIRVWPFYGIGGDCIPKAKYSLEIEGYDLQHKLKGSMTFQILFFCTIAMRYCGHTEDAVAIYMYFFGPIYLMMGFVANSLCTFRELKGLAMVSYPATFPIFIHLCSHHICSK